MTLSYSWTCKGAPCEGTEVASGNRLMIGVLNSGNHQGTFTCSVTGSGVSVRGTFSLIVNGETSALICTLFDVCIGAPIVLYM